MPARLPFRPPLPGPARPRRAHGWRWFALAVWTLAACGLLALPGPAARGDIQTPPKPTGRGAREQQRRQSEEPPASAVAQRTRVRLEGRVDILLEARGHIGETIDFLIRTPPAHGTLTGPPRQVTRTTAVVTYVHHAADGPQADGFTFAVQAPGTPVSASAAVAIDVIDAAPSVVVTPVELDFGLVNVGDTSHAEITLENQGGGAAMGQVQPPAPWEIEGSADYHLAHGERQTFQVVFRPNKGDTFVDSLHFAGLVGGHSVRLLGTAFETPPPAPPASPAQISPPLVAVPDTGGSARPADAAPDASPTPTPPPARTPAVTAATANAPAVRPGEFPPEPDAPSINTAQVKRVTLRAAGSDTLDLAWTPPVPLPRSYRVEMRYLLFALPTGDAARDAVAPPRIEWRLYPSVDIRAGSKQVTARLRGLAEATIYALRVVSVDTAGQLSSPSPVVYVRTGLASTFWHPTPLKVLVVLLLGCVTFYGRRRWEERRQLHALDAEQLESFSIHESSADED